MVNKSFGSAVALSQPIHLDRHRIPAGLPQLVRVPLPLLAAGREVSENRQDHPPNGRKSVNPLRKGGPKMGRRRSKQAEEGAGRRRKSQWMRN